MIGFLIFNRIASDLRKVVIAARKISVGELDTTVPLKREDEIGDLSHSIMQLQSRLMTDRLTGIGNREGILHKLD